MRKYKLTDTVRLFHLSRYKHPDGTMFRPRIPENGLYLEDEKTKRVCVSTSISGCFLAMGFENDYTYAWIFEPVNYKKIENHIFQPTKNEVPDVTETREKWITCPVKMKCVGYATMNSTQRGKGKIKIHFDTKL